MLQMKEEIKLSCNKSTGKLRCLLVPHRVPKAVSSITDASVAPAPPAPSSLLSLLPSPPARELFAPSVLGLSPLPPTDLLCSQPARGQLYHPREVGGWAEQGGGQEPTRATRGEGGSSRAVEEGWAGAPGIRAVPWLSSQGVLQGQRGTQQSKINSCFTLTKTEERGRGG